MKIGFIGLGRMGREMVLHLLEEGVEVVGYNRTREKADQLKSQIPSTKYQISTNIQFSNSKQASTNGLFYASNTISELLKQLPSPRIIWLMVPHGKPVDEMIGKLLEAGLLKGDIIIDGGNSYYEDSVRRYQELKKKGIDFLDIGTSGGLEGARNGACLMAGGEEEVYKIVKPILKVLAGKTGTETYFGPAGAGHFVKMAHNGIEYGMLEAIGEGFELIHKGPYKLDLAQVADNYSKGSVVRGWLIELLSEALDNKKLINNADGIIRGGETGEWTVETGNKHKVELPVIRASLEARKKSYQKPSFSGKIVSVIRWMFGGHKISD